MAITDEAHLELIRSFLKKPKGRIGKRFIYDRNTEGSPVRYRYPGNDGDEPEKVGLHTVYKLTCNIRKNYPVLKSYYTTDDVLAAIIEILDLKETDISKYRKANTEVTSKGRATKKARNKQIESSLTSINLAYK